MVTSANASGMSVHATADQRNDRTVPPNRSWLTTPASATTSPDDVPRNAANAPATTSAASSSPPSPGTRRVGSVRTTVSATPGAARSGATTRATSPSVLDTM
ncbi:Uncharacterised protein [Mycobacteroides abscessus]|nr:Uncharacterised protein [Mycobacteroides abscessus]